jgi:hypothetical protein
VKSFTCLVFVAFISVVFCRAQLPPMSLIGPTSPEQCATFERNVRQFFDQIAQQHTDCLKRSKQDEKGDYGQPNCFIEKSSISARTRDGGGHYR